MTAEKTTVYRCDLCKASVATPLMPGNTPAMMGVIKLKHGDLHTVPAVEADRHLCSFCMASIQAMNKICGRGYWHCNGGPHCSKTQH